MDLWVLVVGLVMLAVALPVAGRRVFFLFRLITSGQPAPDRVENVTKRLGEAIKTQVVEVFAQRKLLKWSVPGAAHFFVFWAFVILGSVYLEAFGILFSRNPEWAIPIVGHWDAARLRPGLHRRHVPRRPRQRSRSSASATTRTRSAGSPGSAARTSVAPG